MTVFRDVTREKRENDEIRYVSYHDKLTGLYNRAFFEEELIRLNTQRQYPITIIIGDCNGLKIANDIFGHLEGDRLLQTIANILRKATRHEDILGPLGRRRVRDHPAENRPRQPAPSSASASCSSVRKRPLIRSSRAWRLAARPIRKKDWPAKIWSAC